ncbi:MAG: tRNA pseudouridine(55) synthase TruB, partial [Pseudomonadota bacterium]|nr:tRNA pseudouridine(55) synthase TruB [Pseudomonadota bacterium]
MGEATKSINYIKYNKKRYLFTIKWGEETDTCDTEGNVIKRSKKRPSYENIEIIVKKFFKGNIKQTPPQYSAVKINGVRAYKLARENIKVKLKKKEINIFNLSVKKPNNKNFCSFDLWCSSGTYVRSLARDISKKLGTVGHAHEIIRIQDNVFKKTNASYLEKIIKLDITSMKKKLYPVDYVLDNIKIINVEKKYSDML